MQNHKPNLHVLTTRELNLVAGKEIKGSVARNVYELQRSIVRLVIREGWTLRSVARSYRISEDLAMACVVAHYNDMLAAREPAEKRQTVYA